MKNEKPSFASAPNGARRAPAAFRPAACLSVALHALLLAGMWMLAPGDGTSSRRPAVVRVALVAAGDVGPFAAPASVAAPAEPATVVDPPQPAPVADVSEPTNVTDAAAPASVPDPPAPRPALPAARNAVPDAPPPAAEDPRPTQPPPPTVERRAAEIPPRADPQRRAATPPPSALRRFVPDAPDAPAEPVTGPADAIEPQHTPEPEPQHAPEPEPQLVLEPQPQLALEPEPEPEAEPQLAPMTGEQRRMLDRKIADLARDFDNLDETAELAWEHDGQTYSATITELPAAHGMAIDRVHVAVSTERAGSRWSTELALQRLAFSSFAQFVDRWDPSVQIHDDRIDGRFHSNSEIYVARSGDVQPEFLGKVTTARSVNTSQSSRSVRRDQVFLGGLETRVPRIVLPKRYSLFENGSEIDAARIVSIASAARLVFHRDGSYMLQDLERSAPAQRGALGEEPRYFIAAEDAALHVRGVVDGKVLVYSPEEIVVEGDLIYAAHPRAAESDDYVGLVSDGDIAIAEPDVTGPGDLTVHAALFARRRFVVRNYSRGTRATLAVYGSVAAGSVSATEPRFRTNLEFDARLERLRPPHFPLTDRYDIAAWDARWTLVER